jgi:hypothetical protein
MLGSTVRTARRRIAALFACVAIGGAALAQDTLPVPPAAPPSAPAPAAGVPVAAAPPAAPAAADIGEARLEQLVAPIALYPDPLLAQILMAATYPLEIVEAARWVDDPANQALAGDALSGAVAAQGWAPSVAALAAFPVVLDRMSRELSWTEALGNAFLAEPKGVMAAVQSLRRRAMAAGTLAATPQCDCRVAASGEGIAIPPAEPEDLRVPVYGPEVYGSWPYPDYPPDDFPPPAGFAYWPGFSIGFEPPIDLALFGGLWGRSRIDWGRRVIIVERRGDAPVKEGIWVHDPAHRGGVRYPDAATRSRFDAARVAALARSAKAAAAPPVPVDAGERLVVLRNAAMREFAAGTAPVTVLRGAAPVARGEPASRAAAVRRVSPAFHAAPAVYRRAPAPHSRPPATDYSGRRQ